MSQRPIRITVKNMTDNSILLERVIRTFPIVFGRSMECHLSMPSVGYLSRTHGCIYLDGEVLVVMDLNSRNGIYVGKERVNFHRMTEHDQFQIGPILFQIQQLPQPEIEPRLNFTTVTSTQHTVRAQVAAPPPLKMAAPTQAIKAAVMKAPVAAPPAPTPKPQMKATGTENILQHAEVPEIVFTQPQERRQENRRPFSWIESSPGPGLRAVLFWKDDVFDIRQFLPGDQILIGKDELSPLMLPLLSSTKCYGHVTVSGEAVLNLSTGTQWEAQTLEPKNLNSERTPSGETLHLRAGALLTIHLGGDIDLQLGFTEINRPFLRRTWIENKEEIKHAARVSSVIHSIICLLALFANPKQEAPKVENVPPRFARLLVSPPKQIFAPTPPPEVKPEPPKPTPIKTAAPKPKHMTKPTKVAKTHPPTHAQKTKAPAPDAADQMLNAFSAISNDAPAAAVDLTHVKVDTTAKNKNFSADNMMQTLKSKAGKLAAGSGEANPMLNGANAKFKGVGGNAGARDVKGQVVGKARFGGPHSPQGLTDREVMAAVNKHVGAIQQCYERALLDNTSISGRVEYEWTVSPSGTVTDAQVKKSEISGGDGLNDCVLGVIKGINFPAAKNGLPTIVDIGFPFGHS